MDINANVKVQLQDTDQILKNQAEIAKAIKAQGDMISQILVLVHGIASNDPATLKALTDKLKTSSDALKQAMDAINQPQPSAG